MAGPCCASDISITNKRLNTVGLAEPALSTNDARKKWLIINNGPGVIWVHKAQAEVDVVAPGRGIPIALGGSFIDDATPVTYCGEVWIAADVAATDAIIVEWS